MTWQDTPERYGLVTRTLHWLMAALFVWQFAGMAVRLTVGRAPITSFMVGTHAPVGTLLLTLLVVRVVWAFASRRRRPPYEPGALGLAARAGHVALYALMLVVPALALLRMYGSGRGFAPFGLPLFAPRPDRIEWMMAPANAVHGKFAWLLLALIAGHVLAALWHCLVRRDAVLSRMAGPPRATAPAAAR